MNTARVLGLIPARGGSKGLKRKNIKTIYGKPLVAWTIEAALDSNCITDVVVSTDDDEIAAIAKAHGALVPFKRPANLSGDHSLRNQVVEHALNHLVEYEYIILLQPTSPLRRGDHIDEAFSLMVNEGLESCVSVVEQHPSPFWMYSLSQENKLIPMFKFGKNQPRQELKKYYSLNGAIFISSVKNFFDAGFSDPFVNELTVAYIMNPNCSIDIDTQMDFEVAELFLQSENELLK